MLVKVPLNPAPIIDGMSFNDISAIKAKITDIPIIDRKGCIFNFDIANIITAIHITKTIINNPPEILISS